ncbi:hypothetical protein BL250_12605 [Erwinia sp. OLTSP20]|uniref:LysR substrate-binding domain-containing protein n=1 Tax=unclassified Erwinia TaxID=2622719 RepID=UPI000C1839C2|nr:MULTISPECIES: LysR substrate-binding domain-containing protein [unclassified Erwinia]PIJ50230.1 hypothetical protein BV501_09115 [Erwinia sp. OAMSP11]PIJ72067.1 hypothetical protein BK416_10015 [Erwinia sp. OLSSP12]PIJ81358.1 hypothetical protein BLD47_08840 [Erwinia sp. OLCASP19]PIJ84064.1 hypothetical protein BLD46_08420 [Erwinia sp. OLMTSP26]PIJ85763.1 hypothetical protein BLD49_09640 [Erwinia sp. OLMDSP33]
MDQKSLTAFLVLAEELQFSRAAQRLGVTQSALSQQIIRLEKEIGVELFERTRRSVRLSDCGQLFLVDARNVILQIEKATETARRAAKGLLGKMTIAYVDAAPFSLLSPMLMAYQKAFPDVKLVLQDMTSAEQFEALQEGKIDIGLLRPLYEMENIHTATLLREPYVVAMHKEHPLAELEALDIRLLIREKFLFTRQEKAKYINQNFDPLFKHHGMTPDIVQEVNQLHALLSLIGAGMGIAFLPLSVAANNNHNVVYRRLTATRIPQAELRIAWRETANEKLVGQFVRVAKQVSHDWPVFR